MTTTTKRELTPWARTAKAVRTALRNTARESLGNLPATADVRVTSSSFAGGASVDVTICGADDWAWRPATEHDPIVSTYHSPVGTPTLTDEASTAGRIIAEVIRECRTVVGEGYIWGGVYYGGTTFTGAGGTVIGTVAQHGWQPGQD
jgi:hypothetical protein